MNRPESSNTPLEPTVELSLSNVQIHVTVSWWGFEVHLNEDATQLLEDIRDLAAKLAKYLDPELAPVITAAMLVEKLWIKAVDRGNGVRLVSPWISPTMLIPWPEDEVEHVDDNSLYWSVYDSTNGWSDDHRFPASYAEVGPAVADYDGRLVCVHRGPSADSYLFCTTHDADRGWTRDQRMPQHTTEAEPALAELDGLLYCVHRGDGNDIDLWWTCFDGTGWSDARVLPQSLSSSGPALAQFQGRLHCVHRGAEDDNLWWTTFDGTSWEDGRKLPLHTTSTPALAVYDGVQYCVYRGSDSDFRWATFDGQTWTSIDTIGVYASGGPALAVFDGRLYCSYVGDRCDMYFISYGGGEEWSGAHRMPTHGNDAPALIAYRDRYGQQDSLMCIHRGRRT